MIRRLVALATAMLLLPAVGLAADAPARREVGPLIYDNIPQASAEIREGLRRYQNARSAQFQDWLSDGSMLITTRFGETAQLHRVGAPGGERTQLTFFDDPIARAVGVPRSNRYLYSRDAGGAEYFQAWLTDGRGGEAQITDPGSRNLAFVFSRDGRWLAWSRANAGDPNYDLMVMRTDDPAGRRKVFDGIGEYFPLDFSADGRKLLMGLERSAADSERYVLDLQSGAVTEIAPSTAEVAWSGGRFTADGRAIVALNDAGSDVQRLVRIDLADGRTRVLSQPLPWNVEAFDLTEDGRVVAWSMNVDGYSRIAVRDMEDKVQLRQPDLPKGVLNALSFTADGRSLAIGLSTPTANGDVWVWDVLKGGPVRWTRSELGGLDPQGLVAPELVRFRSFDGLQVPAFVYRPKAARGPVPVIIDIHGGPESQARPAFNARTQYFVGELGAAVIQPNVRGSDGYGKRYLGLDNGARREDSVKDIGALLDWIAAQPGLDRSRVVVYGGSYGGYMALSSLAHYSDRLAGAVDIVGISNWTSFLTNTEGYRRDSRRAEYGDERDPAMRAVFDRISPLNLTPAMTRPLLVIQGYNDPRVPRSEAEQIVARLRGQGGEVWFLMARDEGHGFRKKPNVDAQREVETLFLRRLFGDRRAAAAERPASR
jgi:dipeptidyl aminopeptidase/acylaminoacyl peptidase